MIAYATETIMHQFNLNPPDKLSPANIPLARQILARDLGNSLHEWGLDFFEFRGRKCFVAVHRASHFALFLFDENCTDHLGNIIAHRLFEIYAGDLTMTYSLLNMFADDKYLVYVQNNSQSITAMLNHMIVDFAKCGDTFHGYIDNNNVLHTRQINRSVNFDYAIKRRINGKDITIHAGLYFRELIVAQYGQKQDLKNSSP